MGAIASQITSLTIVYSTIYSDADQRKTSKLRVTGLCAANSTAIQRGPMNSPRKWPVTQEIFPFDDVIIKSDAILFTWYEFNVYFLFANNYAAYPVY